MVSVMRRQGKGRVGLLMASTALAAFWLIGEAGAQDQAPQQLAQAGQSFNIPPQPLIDALALFGRQSGMQVSVNAALIRDLRSGGVEGAVSAQQALGQLLAGTGVTYRLTDANTAILERKTTAQTDDGTIQLDPIMVEGQGESAFGPVPGYVATRSATGTKTDTPLLETPQSISVVTAAQVETLKPQTVAEALRYSPGIMAESSGVQPITDSYMIRGFGVNAGAVYQDGMRRADTGGGYYGYDAIEPYGLERIENLRGPTSVLYGQNEPGGLVNVVTKRPPREAMGEVLLQGGSFKHKQGAFDIGGPVDESGKFSFRLTGLAREADTQVDFVKNNRQFLAGALSWRPTDDTELTFLADYITAEGAYMRGLPAQGTVLSNPNGKIPSNRFVGEPGFNKMTNDRISAGYRLQHRLSETFTLRQNLHYGHFDLDRRVLFTGALDKQQLRTITRSSYAITSETDTLTLDNQIQSDFTVGPLTHKVLFGADIRDKAYDSKSIWVANGAAKLDLFKPVYGSPVTLPATNQDWITKQQQFGLYLQDQIKFGSWSLLLGGRHDWAKSETKNRVKKSTTRKSDRAFTGRAGLVYQFANGLAPYVSYGESFSPVSGTDAAGKPFKPETGVQYEIGLRYQPPGSNSLVSIAAFDLRRQNVTTADPNNKGKRVQTGEVTSRGIELEAKLSLNEDVSLIGAYTFNDVEVTKSNGADRGKTPSRVPAHTASLWTQYAPEDGALHGGASAVAVAMRDHPMATASTRSKCRSIWYSIPPFPSILRRYRPIWKAPAWNSMRAICWIRNM